MFRKRDFPCVYCLASPTVRWSGMCSCAIVCISFTMNQRKENKWVRSGAPEKSGVRDLASIVARKMKFTSLDLLLAPATTAAEYPPWSRLSLHHCALYLGPFVRTIWLENMTTRGSLRSSMSQDHSGKRFLTHSFDNSPKWQ